MKIGDIAHIASEPNRHWKGKVIGKREQHNITVVEVEGIEDKEYKAITNISCFILKNDEYWMYSVDNYCVVCKREVKTVMQTKGCGVCANCSRRIIRNYISDNDLIPEK